MKERRNIHLWQAYQFWYELMEMRKKHILRISAANRGVSNLDAKFEQNMMDSLKLDRFVNPKNKEEREKSYKTVMINYGIAVGPIWDWCLAIKGMGDGLTAQLLSQIDHISHFDNLTSLWRFCGYGNYRYWLDNKGAYMAPLDGYISVKSSKSGRGESYWMVVCDEDYDYVLPDRIQSKIEDGVVIGWNRKLPKDDWELKIVPDKKIKGYHRPYNNKLKSVFYNISESFIKHQTPYYIDIYYDEKYKQRAKHPVPFCNVCKLQTETYQRKVKGKMVSANRCPKKHKNLSYTDGHINFMGRRKMLKALIKDIFNTWRQFENV